MTKQNVRSLAWLCLGFSGFAHAAAFQILEQNVSSLGSAYSGTAVLKQDATAAFYNPAALVYIRDKQFVQSVAMADGQVDLAISRSLSLVGDPVDGSYHTSPGGVAVIPGMHYARRINDRLVFGLSVAPPFGAKIDYSNTSAARYVSTLSELMVLGIIPSVAYRLSPQWSIAAGPDADWVLAKFHAQLGTGTIDTDGYNEKKLSNWGYGWHAGMLFEPIDDFRAGVHYRSTVRMHPNGISHTLLAPGDAVIKGTASTQFNLPESAVLSVHHAFHPQWAWTGDVQWTRWNRFDVLTLQGVAYNDDIGETTTTLQLPQYFHNSVRLAAGLEYTLNDKWLFRTGVANDPTPVQDLYRNARLPDSNRRWVAFGAQYRWTQSLKLDMGYAHLFFKPANVDDHGPIDGTTGGHFLIDTEMVGRYHTKADILGIQISWDFV